MKDRLSDLIEIASKRNGKAPALRHNADSLSYDEFASHVVRFACGLRELGLERNDRVAILTGKNFENATAIFGVASAGGVFVPINTLLKAEQVAYILEDCGVSVLVTTASRWSALRDICAKCLNLNHVVLIGDARTDRNDDADHGVSEVSWTDLMSVGEGVVESPAIGTDMAAIMYTSGSTGKPKGVVLSHLNLLVGASSVARYIGNSPSDVILAVLPFSFDAGLSQLMTGVYSGACVVLHDYLLPKDVLRIVERDEVTGITGVPPLWIQLADQDWSGIDTESVRYFANTGGKMPKTTLARLRSIFPRAAPFLMYGLTEAFRSTYLPPDQVDTRPDSIGKAIPNAEILVVSDDGTPCEADQVGELVHRGPLVSLGYWNDPERTAERFRPAPCQPDGLPIRELAVWSGDYVRKDREGYLYFVGRKDDMIKTSGYRVSPSEIEEVVYGSGLVSEVAALGLPDARLGQVVVIVAKSNVPGEQSTDQLLRHMREHLPNYMIPAHVEWRDILPRNANGKMDRPLIAQQLAECWTS